MTGITNRQRLGYEHTQRLYAASMLRATGPVADVSGRAVAGSDRQGKRVVGDAPLTPAIALDSRTQKNQPGGGPAGSAALNSDFKDQGEANR